MKKNWLFFVAILLAGSILALDFQPVLADDIFPSDSIDCTKAPDSAICKSQVGPDTNPLSGQNGLLNRITNIVAIVAGFAAIIMVILGGIRFITSGGDPNNVKSARNTVLYALIGIIVIVLARMLILFVINEYND